MNNAIVLKGDPIRHEAPATAAMNPGHFVEPVENGVGLVDGSTNTLVRPRLVMPADYIGNGLTDEFAAGDVVQYAAFDTGDWAYARAAASTTFTRGDRVIVNASGVAAVATTETSDLVVGYVAETKTTGSTSDEFIKMEVL